MNKYIEIVEYDTDKVVKRYNVTLMSDAGADCVEDGFNHNLNQNIFFVRRVKCETELETGKIE